VFAPVAAALASGTLITSLGPEVSDMERIELPAVAREGDVLRGQIVYVDHFGNLVTNVPADLLPARCTVQIGTTRIHGVAPSYSAGVPGMPLAVVNSWDVLEIAVRDGSARDRLGAAVGEPVVIVPD
jgi:S-adenosylmethionine hydrolase